MSYIKDKIIIDFLCEIERLTEGSNFKADSLSAWVFGFISHSYLNNYKELSPIVDHFNNIHQFEEFQAITEHQKRNLFMKLISETKPNIEKELHEMLTGNVEEESKEIEQEKPVSKEHIKECVETYDDVETILFEHIAFNEEDTRFQTIDFMMWGFFNSQYFNKTSTKRIFDKLSTLRQAQISGLINHNQKVKLFLRLHNDWNLDLNKSFDKLLENPSLGSKPLSSLVVPEEEMNKILLEQLSLEEKFEVEKARIEKEKKDHEGVLCNICLLELYDKDEDIFMMDVCVHHFHESCLGEYLNNQISERKIPVKCPEDGCKVEFTGLDLKELLPEEKLEEFYAYALDSFIQKNAKDMSYCPTAGCGYAFFLNPDITEFRCPLCCQEYCLKCGDVPHEGDCINQFLLIAATLNYKACPYCKFWVEKTSGCDYLACRCGNAFCYRCGRDYNEESRDPCYNKLDNGGYYSNFSERLRRTGTLDTNTFSRPYAPHNRKKDREEKRKQQEYIEEVKKWRSQHGWQVSVPVYEEKIEEPIKEKPKPNLKKIQNRRKV